MASKQQSMAEDESSSEAPEEVGLDTGRQQALKQRQQEIESVKMMKNKKKEQKKVIEERNVSQKRQKQRTVIEVVSGDIDGDEQSESNKDRESGFAEMKKDEDRERSKTKKRKMSRNVKLQSQASEFEFIPLEKKAINRKIYGESSEKVLPFIDFKTQSLMKTGRREKSEDMLRKLEKMRYNRAYA